MLQTAAFNRCLDYWFPDHLRSQPRLRFRSRARFRSMNSVARADTDRSCASDPDDVAAVSRDDGNSNVDRLSVPVIHRSAYSVLETL